jgi:hypothetical protein
MFFKHRQHFFDVAALNFNVVIKEKTAPSPLLTRFSPALRWAEAPGPAITSSTPGRASVSGKTCCSPGTLMMIRQATDCSTAQSTDSCNIWGRLMEAKISAGCEGM